MSMSPSSKKSGSEHKSSPSRASRTSISVKLPSTCSDEGRRRRFSPDRVSSGDEKHTQDGKFSARLEGREFGQAHPAPTPASLQTLSPSPVRSLRHNAHNERELIRQAATSIIERAWIAYRDRQMFCLLKHSVCAAENSLSYEILRKVCPKEAQFLKDKSLQVKVRFRFGGMEFPPMIYFKIFFQTDGKGVKYISGKKMIKPASEAAEDSLRLMGNRLFYDQMLQDALYQQQYHISDEVDVTTLKDYMQYLSNLDETPAYLGGKENFWRKLTLDVLPRHTIFYDIVDYAYNNRMTSRLKEEIPILMSRPITQEIQLQHIQTISQMRTPNVPYPTPKSKPSGHNSQLSGRRTKQARLRAMKMRKMYGLEKEDTGFDSKGGDMSCDPEDYFDKYGIGGDEEEAPPGDDWEHEANKLYEWTQELSFNDEAVATPRLIVST